MSILASFPGSQKVEERAWYTPLVHAFNYFTLLSFVMSSNVDHNARYIIIVLGSRVLGLVRSSSRPMIHY